FWWFWLCALVLCFSLAKFRLPVCQLAHFPVCNSSDSHLLRAVPHVGDRVLAFVCFTGYRLVLVLFDSARFEVLPAAFAAVLIADRGPEVSATVIGTRVCCVVRSAVWTVHRWPFCLRSLWAFGLLVTGAIVSGDTVLRPLPPQVGQNS